MKMLSKLTLMIATILGSNSSLAAPETDVVIAGVPARVDRIELQIKDAGLMSELRAANGNFSYEMTFGRVSESEFKQLKTYFRKSEPLNYKQDVEYKLTDFLPAKMQALMNKRLIATSRRADDLDEIDLFYKNSGEVFTTINCWGTAWEIVRDASVTSPMNLFMSSRRHIQTVLEASSTRVRPQDALFGDVLLLFTRENGTQKLQHAAVYLGYGYYFERTDSGSAMFFRIAHLDDMRTRLGAAFNGSIDNFGQPITVGFELRRFGSPLPDPALVFSAANTADIGEHEYAQALPDSEDKRRVTLFVDDRMGGGDEATVQDMSMLKLRLNPISGRGEIDSNFPGASLLVGSN